MTATYALTLSKTCPPLGKLCYDSLMSTSVPSRPNGPQSAQAPASPPTNSAKSSKAADDSFHDPAFAYLPELKISDLHFRPQRHTTLPIVLFLATCASTFWVGATHWEPLEEVYTKSASAMWQIALANWSTGLQYMVAVYGRADVYAADGHGSQPHLRAVRRALSCLFLYRS